MMSPGLMYGLVVFLCCQVGFRITATKVSQGEVKRERDAQGLGLDAHTTRQMTLCVPPVSCDITCPQKNYNPGHDSYRMVLDLNASRSNHTRPLASTQAQARQKKCTIV